MDCILINGRDGGNGCDYRRLVDGNYKSDFEVCHGHLRNVEWRVQWHIMLLVTVLRESCNWVGE